MAKLINPLLAKQHHPSKRLGQNFLLDENIAQKIVSFSTSASEDTVIELGAGAGALTTILAGKAKRLIAIEIDAKLVTILHEFFDGHDNVEIIHADAAAIDYRLFKTEAPLKVVGNLPYYISSKIIFNILEQYEIITSATIMLQKELAQRLLAPQSTKDYGVPTVLLGMFADIKHGFSVSPSCFYPTPKVDSTVLRIDFLQGSRFALSDVALFRRTVKTLFAQRRKTIFNNLKHMFDNDAELVQRVLTEAAVLPVNRRAESLTVEDFARLANHILLLQQQKDGL